MKYVIILTLLLLAGGVLYWRLRPYIAVVRRVFMAVRDAKRMTAQDAPSDLRRRTDGGRDNAGVKAGEKLVRCAACGTWLPASRAVTFRTSNSTFCSHACLE
ncbi:MAG TPA: hypothetical protein VM866_02210, partial [Pyrinomonadaceae bacterium]|nr:hypothetical protein [Pyrinomonadaceae bacterium]